MPKMQEIHRPEQTLSPEEMIVRTELLEMIKTGTSDLISKRKKIEDELAAKRISSMTAEQLYLYIRTTAFAQMKEACEKSKVEHLRNLVARISNYVNNNCMTLAQANELRVVLRARFN